MRRRNSIVFIVGAVALLAVVIGSNLRLTAEENPAAAFVGNKVTPPTKVDLTGISNRQVIANIYEVPAGKMVPLRFHHGDEIHLVLSGEWAAQAEGKPDHVMKPGDSQYVEREHWYGGQALGADPLKVLGVMIVEKDKPITEWKH